MSEKPTEAEVLKRHELGAHAVRGSRADKAGKKRLQWFRPLKEVSGDFAGQCSKSFIFNNSSAKDV